MSRTISSFIRRGTAFLTPSSSTSDLIATKATFTTAPEGSLFPKVDPAIDGEDCERDCESCTIHYPAKFSVDEEEKLYGQIKGWATHMLVATGKTDWVKDVGDEKGSVMEAVRECGVKPSNGVCRNGSLQSRIPSAACSEVSIATYALRLKHACAPQPPRLHDLGPLHPTNDSPPSALLHNRRECYSSFRSSINNPIH